MAKIGSFLLLLFLQISTFAAEAPKVTVVTSPNPLPETESLQLRIEVVIEGNQQIYRPEFDAPDFTAVGSGVSGSTKSLYTNGQLTLERRTTYTFILFPKKTGALKISNITVRVGSDTLRSPDQMVKVVDGGASAPPTQTNSGTDDESGGQQVREEDENSANSRLDAPAFFNSDFTVHAQVSKRKAYVGEAVIVDYFIYDFGGIRQLEIQKWPTFNGFWSEDKEIVTRPQFEDLYVKNQRVRRAFISRYAIYGIKPGKLPLAKLVVNARYASGNSNLFDNDDPFNFFGGPLRTGTHSSQDVTIEVLPLPEEGRPKNFGGAVGKFSMRLDADKTSTPANTPLTLNLTIEGQGNFQAIESIKLPIPGDFELYESSTSAKAGSGPPGMPKPLETKKVFQYIVIPRKSGTFEIPAIEWSYFDTAKNSYQTISTKSLSLQITEGAPGQAQENQYASKKQLQDEAANLKAGEDIRYLKEPGSGSTISLSKILTALNAILTAIIALFVVKLILSKRDKFKALTTNPYSDLINQLKDGPKNKIDPAQVEEIFLQGLSIALNTNARGMTRTEIGDAWKDRELPAETFYKISAFLDEVDRSRYGKTGKNETAASLANHAHTLLKELSQLGSKKARK